MVSNPDELAIPQVPEQLVTGFQRGFLPSEDLAVWVASTFIDETGVLANPDHQHLAAATIGYLWTNVDNTKKGRTIIGTAELGKPQGAMGKWPRARAELQVIEWFGHTPDFIITILAPWWDEATNVERCALIEHELYHCAQDKDEFGQPKFNKSTGLPSFTMRGHDVEEFIGVAARYGATDPVVRELVDVINAGPEIGGAAINLACGICSKA